MNKAQSMNYNPNIHHRRSIRLKGYDYAQAGVYFLTLCTQNQMHLFGEIHNGKMELNIFGKIAQEEWIKTIEIRKNIAIAEYIIMPNHIHGIIEIKYSKGNTENIGKFKSPTQTIGAIIRGYKGATTKRIKILISEIKKAEKLFQKSQKSLNNKGESAPSMSTGGLQSAPTSSESAPTSSESAPTSSESAPTSSESAPTSSESARSESIPSKSASFESAPNSIQSTGGLQSAPTSELIRIIAQIDLSKSIWQRDYYEHIIRDDKAYRNISKYIINNPEKWEVDKFHKKKN